MTYDGFEDATSGQVKSTSTQHSHEVWHSELDTATEMEDWGSLESVMLLFF